MKALAAILTELNQPLEILEIEIPSLKRGQALVKILYSGLCHSQLNEWKGIKGPDPYLPHTFGHEGSGIVLEIGEGVTKVKTDDHVVLSWIKGAGLDVPRTLYTCHNRTINSGAISTFLEYAVISENRLVPISSNISLREAALLGCAIPTGAGVVLNDMKIKEGQSIAIFGVGGIGLSALIAAKHAKAHPIVAIDIIDEKLAKAKDLGATHIIHAIKENLQEKLIEIFEGKGADFAFESAGKRTVMEAAFESVRSTGGCCVLAGNLSKGEKIQIDPLELIKGKKIIGTWGGSSLIDNEIPWYADNFISKKNLINPLISHEVELLEINSLMNLLDNGLISRGLVKFS